MLRQQQELVPATFVFLDGDQVIAGRLRRSGPGLGHAGLQTR